MPGPTLRLFGPMTAVSPSGEEVGLGGARQRAVLAMLALRVGRPVAVDALVDGVWGEDPPTTVTNTIQVYVSALRKALGTVGLTIERSGASYRLVAGIDDVDVSCVERLCAEGRAALRSDDPARAVALLERAADLQAAEPLVGLDDRPFAGPARQAIDAVVRAAAVDHVEALGRVDRAADAVVVAERLVARYRHDEACWAALMTASYRAGRQQDALSAFTRCRAVLLDDLGLDPSPALVDLERAILEHTLAPVATGDEDDETPSPLPAAQPLVGRDALLDEIASLLGTARLVTLHGLGGIGKTSLALAVGERLARSGQAVRFADLTAVTAAENALEELCRALGIDGSVDALGALHRAGPAVLIVDNAEQVADLPVRLAEVLRRNGSLRLLVTSRVPLQVRDEHTVAVPPLPIHPGPDGEPDAVRLFEVCARRARPGVDLGDRAAVGALCELTGGLPLAIELVARRVRSASPARLLEQLRARADRMVDLEGGPDVPARQRSIRTVIEWSIDRLSSEARAVLVALTPVNGPVSWSMIDALAGDAEWTEGVDELTAAGLVNGPDSHDLFRVPVPVIEVVRSRHDVGPAGERVVEVIRDLVADGGRPPGELAVDVATVDAAMGLAVAGVDASRALDLLVGLLSYWIVADRLGEGARFADDVRRLPLDAGQRAVAAIAGGICAARVNRSDAFDLLTVGLDTAGDVPDRYRRLVVNAWCYLGARHCYALAIDEARRCADRAAAAAEGDAPSTSLVRDFRLHVAVYARDHDEALRLVREGLSDARRHGDRFVTVELLDRMSGVLVELGRPGEADLALAEAFELARGTSIGALASHLVIDQANVDLALERPASAIGNAAQALASLHQRGGDTLNEAVALRLAAAGFALAGGVAAAAQLDGAANALVADLGLPDHALWTAPSQAALSAVRGHPGYEAMAAIGAADPARAMRRWLGATASS